MVGHCRTTYSKPQSLEPSNDDFLLLLDELEVWRQSAPGSLVESNIPKLSSIRIDSIYYQALMLLFRPILSRDFLEDSLLSSCASLSADACEVCFIFFEANGILKVSQATRQLSLDPQTHNSPITVYNCFRCGTTLLQCVIRQPLALSRGRTTRAIISCSGALAVYTRTLSLASPFLELFDKLSDYFLSSEESTSAVDLDSLLHNVIWSDPTDIPRYVTPHTSIDLQL